MAFRVVESRVNPYYVSHCTQLNFAIIGTRANFGVANADPRDDMNSAGRMCKRNLSSLAQGQRLAPTVYLGRRQSPPVRFASEPVRTVAQAQAAQCDALPPRGRARRNACRHRHSNARHGCAPRGHDSMALKTARRVGAVMRDAVFVDWLAGRAASRWPSPKRPRRAIAAAAAARVGSTHTITHRRAVWSLRNAPSATPILRPLTTPILSATMPAARVGARARSALGNSASQHPGRS
ncbi:hypothetical protein HYPSUDRAFT_214682 [Hypholoma sublateritium FD-334 SS-4]|uniref:Uncharacterized protein n=1 Tax=Hypholoma sublateritium (strain FD-334 SS-4) TaxID=945553 RepID=A0A0D2P6H5_HYPSF|nr:hypothetical protein HYPSUDRAFT_214682 [Hypholoma sublateritium FD-334 SS-4]